MTEMTQFSFDNDGLNINPPPGTILVCLNWDDTWRLKNELAAVELCHHCHRPLVEPADIQQGLHDDCYYKLADKASRGI